MYRSGPFTLGQQAVVDKTGTMFLLRDILGAHFSSWAGRSHVVDDITLPGWLERRWGWSAKRERRRYEQVERTYEREPVGKVATRDW